MKTSTSDEDFAKAIREWFDEDRRGAAEAKLMFETGFRHERAE